MCNFSVDIFDVVVINASPRNKDNDLLFERPVEVVQTAAVGLQPHPRGPLQTLAPLARPHQLLVRRADLLHFFFQLYIKQLHRLRVLFDYM